MVEVSGGRGAWSPDGHATGIVYYAYRPPLPIDGSNPDDAMPEVWVDRVQRGIKAIKGLLIEWGYPADLNRAARWGKADNDALVAFQLDRDILSDGFCGAITMEELLRPTWLSVAAAKKVAPRWLYAFASAESGLDPGAQGEENPPDSGLYQFNVEALTDVTLGAAYDPRMATKMFANRWLAALAKYESPNRRLTIDCAIAQHRSPGAADAWFASGQGTGSIVEYVNTVRAAAQEWRP